MIGALPSIRLCRQFWATTCGQQDLDYIVANSYLNYTVSHQLVLGSAASLLNGRHYLLITITHLYGHNMLQRRITMAVQCKKRTMLTHWIFLRLLVKISAWVAKGSRGVQMPTDTEWCWKILRVPNACSKLLLCQVSMFPVIPTCMFMNTVIYVLNVHVERYSDCHVHDYGCIFMFSIDSCYNHWQPEQFAGDWWFFKRKNTFFYY